MAQQEVTLARKEMAEDKGSISIAFPPTPSTTLAFTPTLTPALEDLMPEFSIPNLTATISPLTSPGDSMNPEKSNNEQVTFQHMVREIK